MLDVAARCPNNSEYISMQHTYTVLHAPPHSDSRNPISASRRSGFTRTHSMVSSTTRITHLSSHRVIPPTHLAISSMWWSWECYFFFFEKGHLGSVISMLNIMEFVIWIPTVIFLIFFVRVNFSFVFKQNIHLEIYSFWLKLVKCWGLRRIYFCSHQNI